MAVGRRWPLRNPKPVYFMESLRSQRLTMPSFTMAPDVEPRVRRPRVAA